MLYGLPCRGEMKMKSFVRLISFILSSLILLSGCSLIMEMDDHPLNYNGGQYRLVRNWEMINSDDYTKNEATWAEKEYDIFVYSDMGNRFIFDEYYQLLYHKEADTLPNYTDIKGVEKMEIIFSDVNKSKTVLDNEEILKTAIELMSQPYDRDSFKNNSPFKKTIAVINVYYKDYPAYQSAVSVLEADDGSIGFVIIDWNESEKVNNSDYIVVPSNSQLRSYFK